MTTDPTTPSCRAGLRAEIAAALEAADYCRDMRRGDLADAVLPVLYREWPWLRSEAEGAAEPSTEQIVRSHVTTLHLIGDQLTQIESWMWEHLANVRAPAATPATTCSAQRLVALEATPRQCIRAAHHTGVSHTDDQGYRWSDTVAMYPTDSTVKVGPPLPHPAEEIEDERAAREHEAAALFRQGLLSDSEVNAAFAMADEDAQRTARRTSLLNLLARLQRGGMTAEEKVALRQHTEAEIREHDTMRSVAAGNKRHVQVMYDELQQADEAARLALEQRQAMAQERYVIQEQRDAADRTRAEVQRDRDQHAAVLSEVLATFVHTVPGYELARVRSGEVDVVTLEKWRSIIAPAAERPWWHQVAMYEQEAVEATRHVLELKDVIEQVRALAVETRDGNASGSTDHKIGKYDVAVAVLALLDEAEQTATEQPSYAQLHAAYTESWQLIEMQKQLLHKLRGLVITAYTDREDQGIRTERCSRCGRDHVAELYETFTKTDEEYAVTFPATADGPARPGRLPGTEA